MPGQFDFHRLIVSRMRLHQALPKPAVIWHKEMQQLMDDHIVPERLVQTRQFGIEVEVAVCGTGSRLLHMHPRPLSSED